jgi:tetratricopeptide (TPR) repeat protein
MNARLFDFRAAAAASLLVCSCATVPPPPHAGGVEASDFEGTIARIEKDDPSSPALLNAQLAYGEYLLSAAPGPCANRLVLAQEQLGSVDGSPEARAMFPDGWARAADLEYRLHLARAACGSKSDRRDDLLAAIAAARRAAELYRKDFDYRSMVIMQFNVAIALREVGEKAAALAALQAVLDTDREYGFRDDAGQNYKLLLRWQGKSAGAPQVAELMADFPRRQAVLKFDWHATDAHVTYESRRVALEDGEIVRSRGAAAFGRHIAPSTTGGGWNISYTHRLSQYEPGVWPSEHKSKPSQLKFPPARFPAVDFKVSANGEFESVTDSTAFATRLIAAADKRIKAAAPPGKDAADLTSDAVATADFALSPGLLEAGTAENYQLETAMWIGAKLEQGVWYEMSAPLSLPGMPEFVVPQRLEFAFTRMVPCTAGAALRACVELVIHAKPDKDALQDVLNDVAGAQEDPYFHYDASTAARIVIDPATLLPYIRDETVSWYASIGKGEGKSMLSSEHLVSTTAYGAQ